MITYRVAGVDDAPSCAALYLAARAAAFPLIPKGLHPISEVIDHFKNTLFPAGTITAACHSEVIVGFSVLVGTELDMLYVRADMTGMGIGTELVTRAKATTRGPLELWAFVSNVPARRFYERCGFTIAYGTDGAGNEERAPDLRYRFEP